MGHCTERSRNYRSNQQIICSYRNKYRQAEVSNRLNHNSGNVLTIHNLSTFLFKIKNNHCTIPSVQCATIGQYFGNCVMYYLCRYRSLQVQQWPTAGVKVNSSSRVSFHIQLSADMRQHGKFPVRKIYICCMTRTFIDILKCIERIKPPVSDGRVEDYIIL